VSQSSQNGGVGIRVPRSEIQKKPCPDPGGVKKAHANETTWDNSETYRDNVSYCVTESALFHSIELCGIPRNFTLFTITRQ
jgi:hypothetical protein